MRAGLTDDFLGSTVKVCGCCPKFHVLNAEGDIAFVIKGPCPCTGLCGICKPCGTVQFDIFLPDGVTIIGNITKLYAGLFQEMATDADNFSCSFPIDVDPRLKAVLLGAIFLIVSHKITYTSRYLSNLFKQLKHFLHFRISRILKKDQNKQKHAVTNKGFKKC